MEAPIGLRDGLAALGVEPTDELAEKLHRYLAELRLWNPRLGLVEAADEDLVSRHILDCAVAYPILRRLASAGKQCSAADLGSGAGLPGIVLALLFPDQTWELVEKQGRRCDFLRNAIAVLRLANASVFQGDFSSRPAGCFDLVTNRAFQPMNSTNIRAQMRLLRPGGILALYKGRRQAILDEVGNLASVSAKLVHELGQDELVPDTAYILPLAVPGLDAERHLVLLRSVQD